MPGHDDDRSAVTPVLKLDRNVGHRQARADDNHAVVQGDGGKAFAAPRVANGARIGCERGADRRRELRWEVPEAQSDGVGQDAPSVRQVETPAAVPTDVDAIGGDRVNRHPP